MKFIPNPADRTEQNVGGERPRLLKPRSTFDRSFSGWGPKIG